MGSGRGDVLRASEFVAAARSDGISMRVAAPYTAAGSALEKVPDAEEAVGSFKRIVREWPDATARAAIVAVAVSLFCLTWAHWNMFERH